VEITMSKTAENVITIEEGWASRQYYCSEHYVTIGYGRKVSDKKNAPLTNEVTTKEKEIIFVKEKIRELSYALMSRYSVAWNKCNQARQAILISMAYQLGLTGVSQFQKMWMALSNGDFSLAAKEMLNSKWAKQTPNRTKRHVEQMERGEIIRYYLTNGEIP
jgi:lysozyme